MPIPPRPVLGATIKERAVFWRACVAAVERSEITARDLCRQTGVSQCSFYAWRKRLRAVPKATLTPTPTPPDTTPPRARPPAAFAKGTAEFVEIASAPSVEPVPMPGVTWLAELTRLSEALHAHLAGVSR